MRMQMVSPGFSSTKRQRMFRKIGRNRIESDEGFSVEMTGDGLVYQEGDRTVRFQVDFVLTPVYLRICLGEFFDCWDPPYETVKLEDEDWHRIAKNIHAAYESQGREVEVNVVPKEVREATKKRVAMCRRKAENLIESDAGFSVDIVNLDTIRYREGGRQTTCRTEYLSHRRLVMVFLAEASDYWDPPFDRERPSEEEWRRIGCNIRDAYWSQDFIVSISLHPPEKRRRIRPTYPPP